jgi:hypothetical protein
MAVVYALPRGAMYALHRRLFGNLRLEPQFGREFGRGQHGDEVDDA